MKVTLVPSSVCVEKADTCQFLTSFLINDTLAIDAGSLGFFHSPQDQARIRHVLISHSHVDHIGSLPIFLENAYEGQGQSVTVYATEPVLDCLHRDIFNDRVWPDFIRLSGEDGRFLRLQTLVPGRAVELDGLRITPVPVDHIVPTVGFLVEDANAAVVFSSDTGPTQELWRVANAAPHLKAVFLEATFPNALAGLADEAKHHTPASLGREVGKLNRQVPILVVHIKPRYFSQVVQELQALGLPNIQIAHADNPYHF